jgi:hypothetical protein
MGFDEVPGRQVKTVLVAFLPTVSTFAERNAERDKWRSDELPADCQEARGEVLSFSRRSSTHLT